MVHGAEPATLAIARDGDGFVIADHDSAGGVELIRIAASGLPHGRATLAPEPAIEQIELVPAGALVLRADQSIELLDVVAVSRARIVAEPGTRIRAIVQRAGRVLAIIDSGTKIRGRWLDTAIGLSWSEPTPPLAIDPVRPIALSPDHRRLVGSRPGLEHAPVLVDLATGKASEKPMCEATAQPTDRNPDPFGSDELVPTALGFFDARTIACSAAGALYWWSTDGTVVTTDGTDPILTTGVELAFGDRVVAGGFGHQIGLYAPAGPHYLGYGFRDLSHLRVAPTGVLIGKGDQQPILIDGHLRERARFSLPKLPGAWTDLLPVDDRYLLTVAARPMAYDAWGSTYQVSVYDAVKRTVHQLLPNHAASNELAYEPATRLLVSSDGVTNLLLRFDPLTHSFSERIEIESKAILKRIYLTDPALAGGVIAIGVHDSDGGLIVDELHAEDMRDGTIKARTSVRISGELRAVDRAGQLYVHGVMDKQDVAVYRHGTTVAMLAGLADHSLRPSQDGRLVAAVGTQRIVLASTDGTVRWQTAAWGATDVVWLPGGELAARYSGALAKLDPFTGELLERQCGWAFGLQETPFETSASTPVVCDAVR